MPQVDVVVTYVMQDYAKPAGWYLIAMVDGNPADEAGPFEHADDAKRAVLDFYDMMTNVSAMRERHAEGVTLQ